MTLDDPTPRACAALFLALPLLVCTGADLARRASTDGETRRILTPGAAFAAWLLCVYSASRLLRSFVPGLVLGTLLCALLGVPRAVRVLRDRRRRPARAPGRTTLVLLGFSALTLLAIFPSVLRHFHDEVMTGGHLSTVAQLENGYFPPRFEIFPQLEFNYHYGFDVAAAALAVTLRLPPASGVDAATVLAWVYTGLLGCHLGRRLGGARYGLFTGLLVLFGGGIHLGCPAPGAPLGHHLIGYCDVDGVFANPPLGSYFFQHPFAAGIPLFLGVLALLCDRSSGPLRFRYVLFGVLFAALAQCQIVLFACGAASFVAAESFSRRKLDVRRSLSALACVGASLAVARLLGGFFAPAPYRTETSLVFHLGATHTLLGTVAWHARSCGLLLPLGAFGLWLARRERLFLGLMIAGSLLVPNVVQYRHTWDIVKFTNVANLALALAAGCLFPRLLQGHTWLFGTSRKAGVALAALLVVPLVAWSATFHAAAWLKTPNTMLDPLPAPMSERDAIVASRLRRLVPAGDSVYRGYNASIAYGQVTGLAVVWPENTGFGLAQEMLEARGNLLRKAPADPAVWDRETIRWFVLDASDGVLRRHAERWLREGKAELVLDEAGLRVLHLVTRPP